MGIDILELTAIAATFITALATWVAYRFFGVKFDEKMQSDFKKGITTVAKMLYRRYGAQGAEEDVILTEGLPLLRATNPQAMKYLPEAEAAAVVQIKNAVKDQTEVVAKIVSETGTT